MPIFGTFVYRSQLPLKLCSNFCFFLPSKAKRQLVVDKMDGLRRVNSRVDMFGNLVSTLNIILSSTNTFKDPLTNTTSSVCSLLPLVQLLDYQDSSSHGDGHVQSCRQIFLSQLHSLSLTKLIRSHTLILT